MSLEVIEASGLVTVQDAGRKGWRQFGVPGSGPMDSFALQAANALAGNPIESAAIEIGLGDVTFQAIQDCVIAITGAGYQLSIYMWEFSLWSSFFVRAGWKICLNKINTGMWAYLAVAGGVQTPPVLDSSSTYLRGGFGGFEGRKLQTGDVIRTGVSSHLSYEFAARTLPEGTTKL
jgi:antagonist of KipI